MTNNNDIKQPIDAVILWVDGNDEKHYEKILYYLEDKDKAKTKKFRTRYDQVNEIHYTIDSILKFALSELVIKAVSAYPSFLAIPLFCSSFNSLLNKTTPALFPPLQPLLKPLATYTVTNIQLHIPFT